MAKIDNGVKNNCVLIGLPKSGKSTFIAALWHIVESEEIDNSLKIVSLPEDREYLSNLRKSWLCCTPIERTLVDFKHKITLNIFDKNDKITEFIFPDVSGEMYNNQFEHRKIDTEYFNLIKSADGIILFINPYELKEPISITEGNSLLPEESVPSVENIAKPWEYKDAPTQVVLVDLLQMIKSNINKQIRLAVILSAWDILLNSYDQDLRKISPHEWIEKKCPLLHQFLITNNTSFKFKFFGVSAQGGSYASDIPKLQGHANPSDRIVVLFDGEKSNDLSIPIKWLLNDE